MRLTLSCLLILFLSACSTPDPAPESPVASHGHWRLAMQVGGDPIPLSVYLDTTLTFSFLNGSEVIPTTDYKTDGDSVQFRIAHYPSYIRYHVDAAKRISGRWIDSARSDYSIPFTASHQGPDRSAFPDMTAATDRYKVTFNPGTESAYDAQGLLSGEAGSCSGTFLTETGDYRFLQGSRSDQKLVLSCFDGAHLFFFAADVQGDSLSNGVFRSGKHYSSTWNGERDAAFTLADPDSLTYLTEEYTGEFSFQVLDETGDIRAFRAADYADKLTIVQIFGSWCPNCLDENKYYSDLYKRYANRGLQIIPVAFERQTDFGQNIATISRQFTELGITYPFYIGGTSSKAEASRVFSQLNQVISYPTSVFLGPEGQVLRVHTGFYGPGTGAAYDTFVASTESFIEENLPVLP